MREGIPSIMRTFLDQHLEAVLAIVVLVGGWIATFTRQGARLDSCHENVAKLESRLVEAEDKIEAQPEQRKQERHDLRNEFNAQHGNLRNELKADVLNEAALRISGDRETEQRANVRHAELKSDLVKIQDTLTQLLSITRHGAI